MRNFLLAGCAVILCAGPADAATLADYAPGASCLIGPNHTYKLAMATAGALALMKVERSDAVKQGDIVAQLESGVEQAQIEGARARAATETQIKFKKAVVELTSAKIERLSKLREQNVANQQSVEDAQTAANAAKADYEQAVLDRALATFEVKRLEATLERRLLRAPANGVITAVDLHAGEYADPANAIATLTEIDPLRVDVYLPAAAYPLVRVGAKATIVPRDPEGPPREAEVITRDPQIDASSGLFLLQLRLPNPDGALPAGVRCSVEFSGERDARQ